MSPLHERTVSAPFYFLLEDDFISVFLSWTIFSGIEIFITVLNQCAEILAILLFALS